MTRNHFSKKYYDLYYASPRYLESKEHELEITWTLRYYKVMGYLLFIPARFWAAWQKRRASRASRILRKRRGNKK